MSTGADADIKAYQKYMKALTKRTPEPEPTCDSEQYSKPRFKVGDTVRVGDSTRTIYSVHHSYRMDPAGFYYDEEYLEFAPEPLPEDHVDRFWIPGAWVVNSSEDTVPFVVRGDGYALPLWFYSDGPYQKEELPDIGWSFHPDSPIQEPREL